MELALVSCHGMFQHKKQLLGAFAVYQKRMDGGWKRDANFLTLRLKPVHVALASPFILHHVTHRASELLEWHALETDGRFFLDCVALRVPRDADDLLELARTYVRKWTLYPQFAGLSTRSADNVFGCFMQDTVKLPRLPERIFPTVDARLTSGWLTQLSLAHGDDTELPFYRLRGVPAMQAMLSRLGQEDGLLATPDDFLLTAAGSGTAEQLDALMQACQVAPPLSPFLSALMLDRPDLHALYGARMVRRVLGERSRFLRGATLLVTEYQITQLGGPRLAPIQADARLRETFLDKCGCGAQLLEKSGVLLRLHPRGALPAVTFRAVSLGDVLLGHEERIARAEAQQHHEFARVILSADPAVGFDLSAHRPSQFAHVYIVSAHFFSLTQLRLLLSQLPRPLPGQARTITVYGCPALAPLADATVPRARHIVSAARELARLPTAALDGMARPMRSETMDLIAGALPAVPSAEPPSHAPERISSPSHLYALCHGHTGAPLYLTLPTTLDALPLDELLCYVYLFARFRDQILNVGLAQRVRNAFDRMVHVRPLSSEYWTDADFDPTS
jgi:hypothetical protein